LAWDNPAIAYDLVQMKVAVIGAAGLLGQAIRAEWRGDELVMAGSYDVDIRDRREVQDFLARHWPDWVVLAAA
jgi:dTDP-4-dehydrorhamnose reductase